MQAPSSSYPLLVDECIWTPTPHNWTQVPHDDRNRLNRILRRWEEVARVQATANQDIVYDVELAILPTKMYEWRIFTCAGVGIYPEMMEPMMQEPNVVNIEARMRETGSKNHTRGALCILVSSMERDMEMGSVATSGSVAPPLDGRSYTQHALDDNREALAEVAAAAAAVVSDQADL